MSTNDSKLAVFVNPELRALARRFVRATFTIAVLGFFLMVAIALAYFNVLAGSLPVSRDVLIVLFAVTAAGISVLVAIVWGFRILFIWLGLLDD